MKIDHLQLARRVLRPDRPRLAEARAAVAGIADAKCAWEALAQRGLLPAELIEGGAREFRAAGECPDCAGRREIEIEPPEEPAGVWLECARCAGRGARVGDVAASHPLTRDDGIALAGDPAGIARAEALARQVGAALAPWGVPAPPRAAWAIVSSSFAPRTAFLARRPLAAMHRALEDRATPRAASSLRARMWNAARLAGAAQADAYCATLWRAVVDRRLSVPGLPDEPRCAVAGRPFADLLEPFEPVLAIWHLGYALDAITPDAIVLVGPQLR